MNWGAQNTEHFAARYFGGMAQAYPNRWQVMEGNANSAALVTRTPQPGRVNIVVSGGAAGGPLFAGYVGPGLADAAVAGGPYAAPNAYTLYETAKYLGREKGVLLVYNNFAGDFLNNDMAEELLAMDGVDAASVALCDDMASALGSPRSQRGGRCGVPYLLKAASRCAQEGMGLAAIQQVAQEINQRTATLSTVVDFEKGEIAFGAGFSGEPGIRTETHMDMERMVAQALDMLVEDLHPLPQERLYVLINRLQNTAYTDGYLAAHFAGEHLAPLGVAQMRVAAFSNILDAYGFTFTILCAKESLWPYLAGEVASDSFLL